MKKLTALILLILISLSALAIPAHAEGTLKEFEQQLIQYQKNPYSRAQELKKVLNETIEREDSLSKQMGVPLSVILAYEASLSAAIDDYLSCYYIELKDSTNDTSIIDDDTLEAFVSQKKPYSFAYYLDTITMVAKCQKSIDTKQKLISDYRHNEIKHSELKKDQLYRDFRILSGKLNNNSENMLEISWKLERTKADIEHYFIEKHLAETTIKSESTAINVIQAKYTILQELLKKVRHDIRFSSKNFDEVDSYIVSKISEIEAIINKSDKRYSEISVLHKNNKENSVLKNYIYSNEENQIENEIFILLNLSENWYSLRRIFRNLQEILSNKNSADEDEIIAFKERVDKFLERTKTDTANCLNNLNDIHMLLSEQKEKGNPISDNESITNDNILNHSITNNDRTARDNFILQLSQRKERYINYLFSLMVMTVAYESVQNELNNIVSDPAMKSKDTIEKIKHSLIELHDFELFHIDDNPITLGRIVYALIILLIGAVIAYIINYFIRQHLHRIGLTDKHKILLITMLIKYTLLLISALIALATLEIPITAFAFAGGAIALAFGFGAQKIMTDVLSGITLLFKNRIHVGDHIILDGIYGVVKEISLHDTVVFIEDSKDLVIPNSKFFNVEFINLSLNSSIIRTCITVGIAYSSDIEKARNVILEVLKNSNHVLKQPYYRALFEQFENSSLIFKIEYFMDLKKEYERPCQSAVRGEILSAFRANGIQIPFPQREITLLKKEFTEKNNN